ncbi:ABC transporter ATP-binding protein [Chelatococcus asaccharovorans]|uniref:Carbohydrate ABC transporter ATP-binding protein (CUT1 family) n=1 Tax=Chelatococcus asaccharovorans TaxID=28210 RepID=A0A2V3U311_9HYPH|nr:ABC transporter ATP-binding protein [Chelatococcus asaccharovorans]MBS7702179.1 ABC transporter ATP-binding protein [Chelatococcus asaccharovorans]PXW56623.1 carbohydrate ABC transporter ATP-binding protein (CUT1 family) [Chelatococcus asaccharovorans]
MTSTASPDASPAVSLAGIEKTFGRTKVLHGISLDIPKGTFLSLLGPSGCGKTTLLRIVAGLESATVGQVTIAGRDVTQLPPEDRDIAMMFQSYALMPHMNVRENVRFPLRMRRRGSRDAQEARVAAALETVQLGHLAERMPRQLSGGQQQRVALARAIVSDPAVLLLDEPLSNLDARLREDMQVELIELHRRLGLTTIFVTHDQEEALSLSDHVVLMNAGRIEEQGPPLAIYEAAGSRFAASFIGSANVIPVAVETVGGATMAQLPDGSRLAVEAPVAQGANHLALRQEDLMLGPDDTARSEARSFAAVVETRVFLGARVRYVLKVGDLSLKALAEPGRLYQAGDRVIVTIPPGKARLVA